MEITLVIEVKQSKMQPLEVEPHIELMEEEVRTANLEVGIEPLVVVQVYTTEIANEQLET